MTTGLQHIKAQHRIMGILAKYYGTLRIESFAPTPNNKYVLGDNDEFTIKPYELDVYATQPLCKCLQHHEICVEIDGKKGHKTSSRQTIRDQVRTDDLTKMYPEQQVYRFDTKDLIGKGYVNPKTKRRHPILTDAEILAELGIKCTHV